MAKNILRAVSVAGLSDLETTVVKATFDGDELAPKEKHVKSLIVLTLNESASELPSLLITRIELDKWTASLKGMVVLHRIVLEGDKHFLRYFSSYKSSFDMSRFTRMRDVLIPGRFMIAYGKYLRHVIESYKEFRQPIQRMSKEDLKQWTASASLKELLKRTPSLQAMFSTLLTCLPDSSLGGYGGPQNVPEPLRAAVPLLVKDSLQLFGVLTLHVLAVLDMVAQMEAAETRAAIAILERFQKDYTVFNDWIGELSDLHLLKRASLPSFQPMPAAASKILDARLGELVPGSRRQSDADQSDLVSAYERMAAAEPAHASVSASPASRQAQSARVTPQRAEKQAPTPVVDLFDIDFMASPKMASPAASSPSPSVAASGNAHPSVQPFAVDPFGVDPFATAQEVVDNREKYAAVLASAQSPPASARQSAAPAPNPSFASDPFAANVSPFDHDPFAAAPASAPAPIVPPKKSAPADDWVAFF